MPILGVLALMLALLIKTFLAQAFFIPSGSMENTLRIKDRVIIDKFSGRLGRSVQRGQVVVFRDPGGWLGNEPAGPPGSAVTRTVKKSLVFVGLLPSDDEKVLIKRVVGLPGDTVACCDPSGRVTVNRVPLNEPYVFPNNPPSARPFTVTVPAGRLWMMGDHRSASADSRDHMEDQGQGTIPANQVIGRAFVILWPAEHLELLRVPPTFQLPGIRTPRADTPPPAAPSTVPPVAPAVPPGAPTAPPVAPTARPAAPAVKQPTAPAASFLGILPLAVPLRRRRKVRSHHG